MFLARIRIACETKSDAPHTVPPLCGFEREVSNLLVPMWTFASRGMRSEGGRWPALWRGETQSDRTDLLSPLAYHLRLLQGLVHLARQAARGRPEGLCNYSAMMKH